MKRLRLLILLGIASIVLAVTCWLRQRPATVGAATPAERLDNYRSLKPLRGMSMNQPKRRVLFVCVENSNRSQMAEAFARRHGGDRVEAHSAGSRPSGQVNPRAVQFMSEIGYDLTTHQSKSLNAFNGTDIDVAVTMGCGDACPLVRAKRREEWDIPDPKNLPADDFRKIRDLIERKVQELLASL